MSIEITPYGVKSEIDNYNTDAVMTELEKEAIGYIKREFKKRNIDFGEIRLRRRSKAYLTLLAPNDYDFCRIKAGKQSVWFSVHGFNLPENIKNDSRFDNAKKTLLHWKIKLSSIDDFKDNSDLISESYLSIKKFKK